MPEEVAADFVAEDLFAEEVGGAFAEGGVTAASDVGAFSAAETASANATAASVMPGAISAGGAIADTAGLPAEFAGGAAVEAASSVPGAIKAATPSSFGTGLNALKTAATILAPVASIAGAASGVAASRALPRAGSVLNTPAPLVTPPVTMPTFGSGTSLLNPFSTPVVQRTAIQQQTQRRGRAATILTDPADSERLGA